MSAGNERCNKELGQLPGVVESWDVPIRGSGEALADYAQRVSRSFVETHPLDARRQKGQYFTPVSVARFMAGMAQPPLGDLRVLDPGAGTGCLTAALCERLLRSGKNHRVFVDAYELDEEVGLGLEKVLSECAQDFGKKGHRLEFRIVQEDFILDRAAPDISTCSSGQPSTPSAYDIVIANPPYFKISKDSAQSSAMSELVSGQPNIYFLFMGLSARLLRREAEMVFITPRSFCSGSYYRKFRMWFLRQCVIKDIHIFESRRDIFEGDGILQENIILHAIRSSEPPERVRVTSCKDRTMDGMSEIQVDCQDVVHNAAGECYIRIPSTSVEVEALHTVDAWRNNLRSLNLEISTGPVVPFRAKHYLLTSLGAQARAVPLLWMHNVVGMKVVWPIDKNGKPKVIIDSRQTAHLLVDVSNYVLLKRFSSKEQTRRIYASVLNADEFPYERVGLENHLNYVHRPGGMMTLPEAYGLTAILNGPLIDSYFRALSGNTQVNATEIRGLPLPDKATIIRIGKAVQTKLTDPEQFDIGGIGMRAFESGQV